MRVAQRIRALAAAIWHNNNSGAPITRSLISYDSAVVALGAGLAFLARWESRHVSASRMSSRQPIRCNSMCMPLAPTAGAP